MYRLFLNITTGGTTTQYDATDELRNWADVSLSYKRDGLSGVVRSFSTDFEFVGNARAALVAAYIADGVRSVASVQFQQRDAIAYTYATLFVCALDFSTFRYDAFVASVNAIDNTIAGKLKAQASQKYQYTVAGLTTQAVTYKHLPMLNNVQWFFNEWYDRIYDKEIAYLESTGTQYIDTEIIPDSATGIKVKIESTDTADTYLLGLRDTTGNTRWCIAHSASRYYCGYGTYNVASAITTSPLAECSLNWMADGKFTASDGVNSGSYTLPALSFVPANNIRLFGSAGVSATYSKWNGRIFSVQISQGSAVIMDMIPVRVGTVGYMYDKVSGKLFGNSGTGDFVLGADVQEPSEELYGSFFTKNGQPMATQIPLAVTGSEIAVRGTSNFADVSRQYYTTSDLENKLQPIFTAGVDCTATLVLTLDTHAVMYGTNNVTLWSLIVGKVETGENGARTLTALDTVDMINTRNISLSNDYTLSAGDSLVIYYIASGSADDRVYFIIDSSSLSVTYMAQDNVPVQISTIQPVTLMQALLDSICGVGNVTGAISISDDRFTHTMLMAAESIRGMSGAQIYTSWSDFCEMMDCQFGAVPVINEDARTLVFQSRTAVFTTTVARAFTADEVRDVEVRTADDLLASKVSIGYEKQDYDSVNGRDEWRWVAEYRTGIEVSENEVQMICPYRGDAYGIEFLTLTRSEQTTDKDADEDIFLADCGTIGGVFTMRIDVPVSGIIAVNAMPNARYSQYFMAIENAFALGRLGTLLTFTSIGGNNDAVVQGRAVTANISLTGYTTLKPMELTFSTGVQTQLNWSGLITLPYGGKTYRGWLKDVRFGLGHDKVVTYTLLVNQIS